MNDKKALCWDQWDVKKAEEALAELKEVIKNAAIPTIESPAPPPAERQTAPAS